MSAKTSYRPPFQPNIVRSACRKPRWAAAILAAGALLLIASASYLGYPILDDADILAIARHHGQHYKAVGRRPDHSLLDLMLPLATNSRTRSAARDVLERTSGYLTDLDEAAMNEVWGYELHNLTYDAYVTDLMDMYQEFFVPLTQADPHGYKSSTSYLKDIKHRPLFKPFLDQMAAFLSFLPVRSCPLTRKIHTTMKSYPADLHEEFGTWTSKNPGWKLDYTTDPDWDRWLEEEFRGTGLARELDAIKADNRVIGGDLVRYLLVLIEGGLYTDSDTAAELPVAQWGEKFFEQPVPRLPYDILSDIDDVLPACVSQKQMEDQDQDKEQDDPPSFIIAQEFDYVDWRNQDKASRREVSQWTFYAARGHPILLDALGRSLRAVKEKRLRMGGGKWEMSGFHEILRLAGPTSLANALQRYLIVRYGITPEKLPGITTSLRIGDVLLLPERSFHGYGMAVGVPACSRHKFSGRWGAALPPGDGH